MILDVVGRVDFAASSGATVWHRASALGKLLLALLLVLLVVFAPRFPTIAALAALALVLAATSGLPLRIVAALLLYPLTFALLFVVASWDGTWVTPLRLVLRPMTACLAATWLVGTTPYPDLFAPISRLLPRNVADGLFITYRALFDLLDRTERMARARALRGGARAPFARRLAGAGDALGTLVLHSFERSERRYATMVLRGHSGRICGCRHYADASRADLAVAAAGLVAIGTALATWGRPA